MSSPEKFVSGLPDKEPRHEKTLEEVLKEHAPGIAKENIRRRMGIPHHSPVSENVRKATNRMLGEKDK